MSRRTLNVLTGATTVAAGSALSVLGYPNVRTYQGLLTGTGTLSATVKIQVSNDGANWIDLTTLTLTDAAPTAGYVSTDSWAFVRGDVTAITGTAATASVLLAA